MAEVKIIPCNCTNEYQDKVHGKSRRVMNPAFKKGAELGRYRCTSCGNEIKSK